MLYPPFSPQVFCLCCIIKTLWLLVTANQTVNRSVVEPEEEKPHVFTAHSSSRFSLSQLSLSFQLKREKKRVYFQFKQKRRRKKNREEQKKQTRPRFCVLLSAGKWQLLSDVICCCFLNFKTGSFNFFFFCEERIHTER